MRKIPLIDLEKVQLPETDDFDTDDTTYINERKNKQKKSRKLEDKDRYIRGVPLPWIARIVSLSTDKLLAVALVISYTQGFNTESNEVFIDKYLYTKLGLDKDSLRRGLERLQENGLIAYTRIGHKRKVTILPVEPETS